MTPSLLTRFACALALPALVSLAPIRLSAQGSDVDQSFDRIEQLQQLGAARQRAVNLARNTIVERNGGLGRYTPAACMFAGGRRLEPCLIQKSERGFQFRFMGGPPGWEQRGLPATILSEIWISPDGRRVLEVVYNGPLR
ncbi:MAG: hypothetical protein RLZZ124_835 [Cyanobacteriota bacterium]|jgi:hypothetical protein